MISFIILGFLLINNINIIIGAPTESETLVTVAPIKSEDSPSPAVQNDGGDKSIHIPKPELYSMKVNSQVNTRYATTVVSSRVANPANKSQEVTFSIVIPETAFISEFLMELDGKVYKAYVKKKEEAKQIYDNAVASGIGAGYVGVSARDSNRFTVSVNVEPLSKALFNLTYEELLTRRLGVYNLVLNLNPGQIVRDMSVDVDIVEAQKITTLRTPALRTGNEIDPDENTENNVYAVKEFKNDEKTQAHVKFSPTMGQQRELMKLIKNKLDSKTDSEDSISGQFVVQYDVERDPHGGEIVVYDGYFVHFFAPSGLTPLSKHVVFVLDVSGSMLGLKISQLKEAMNSILDELRPGDYFNLIDFSYEAQVYDLDNFTKRSQPEVSWYRKGEPKSVQLVPAFPANKENIVKAKNVIKQLEAFGGTNIDQALKVALKVAKAGVQQDKSQQATSTEKSSNLVTEGPSIGSTPEPMIIFLTDGDPTVGETSATKILKTVKELNAGSHYAAIFSLAFGNDADRGFLKQLAIRNSGFMRHIYEANDAAVQLQQFYKQISSPLLKNITFVYPPNQVEDVTDHECHILFSGSEFVIAGKLASKDLMPQSSVRLSHGEPTDYISKVLATPVTMQSKPSLERLWAYLKIKQLLDKKDAYIDPEEGPVFDMGTTTSTPLNDEKIKVKDIESKALDLALKYSFVTKLTSLVVVKPNSTSDVAPEIEPLPVPLDTHYSAMALSSFPMAHIQGNILARPLSARPISYAYNSYFGPVSLAGPPGFAPAPSHFQFSHHKATGGYRTTTFRPLATWLTTYATTVINRIDEAETAYEDDITTTEKPRKYNLDHLSWALISNGTIEIGSKNYTIEPSQDKLSFGECDNSLNGTGICIAVSHCSDSLTVLKSENDYLTYACDGQYLGIKYFTMCCSEFSTNDTAPNS